MLGQQLWGTGDGIQINWWVILSSAIQKNIIVEYHCYLDARWHFNIIALYTAMVDIDNNYYFIVRIYAMVLLVLAMIISKEA